MNGILWNFLFRFRLVRGELFESERSKKKQNKRNIVRSHVNHYNFRSFFFLNSSSVVGVVLFHWFQLDSHLFFVRLSSLYLLIQSTTRLIVLFFGFYSLWKNCLHFDQIYFFLSLLYCKTSGVGARFSQLIPVLTTFFSIRTQNSSKEH